MSKPPPVLPMNSNDIMKCIPHRYPFLLVDRVIEMKLGHSIHTIKNFSISDPILQGHFPGNPVVPGVVMIECMAQASAILGSYTLEGDCKDILLLEISKSRFRQKVIPGDVLHIQVKLKKIRSAFFWFEGQALVGDKQVASAEFSALMR